jgi:hypothetical protein
MNERIFKLALKAMDFQGAVDIDTELKLTNSELAKFAELIVEECISTLEEKIYRSIDNEGDEIWADLILKEHFGVEE